VPITFPPPEHPHTWAELLTRRIRDAFADYDGMNKDHCDLNARHDGSQLRI
jgi:hypothetical protein